MARPPIYRLLFVVGRERKQLYDSLRHTFDGDDTVQVVLDRRVGERRRQESTPRTGERRRSDRRAQRESDALLRARGYTLVNVLTFQSPLTGTPASAPERKAVESDQRPRV
jgi:hypothetical protein